MDFLTSIPMTMIASALLLKALTGKAIIWFKVEIFSPEESMIFCRNLLGRFPASMRNSSRFSSYSFFAWGLQASIPDKSSALAQ